MMYHRNNIDKNGDMARKSRYPERDKLDLQEEPVIAKKSAASYYSDHRRCSHHYVREDAIVAELSAER